MNAQALLALGLALTVLAWAMERDPSGETRITNRWPFVAGLAVGLLLLSAAAAVNR